VHFCNTYNSFSSPSLDGSSPNIAGQAISLEQYENYVADVPTLPFASPVLQDEAFPRHEVFKLQDDSRFRVDGGKIRIDLTFSKPPQDENNWVLYHIAYYYNNQNQWVPFPLGDVTCSNCPQEVRLGEVGDEKNWFVDALRSVVTVPVSQLNADAQNYVAIYACRQEFHDGQTQFKCLHRSAESRSDPGLWAIQSFTLEFPECESNADCGTNQRCHNRECKDIPPEPEPDDPCASVTCGEGYLCMGGICFCDQAACTISGRTCLAGIYTCGETCTTSSDCPAGLACVPDLLGLGGNVCVCDSNDDCGAGNYCRILTQDPQGGMCIPQACTGTGDACGLDSVCVNNVCTPLCGVNLECAVGQVCTEGLCQDAECTTHVECSEGFLCQDSACVSVED
jgi:hypothetical protein